MRTVMTLGLTLALAAICFPLAGAERPKRIVHDVELRETEVPLACNCLNANAHIPSL
jgi:hypothetical protein